MSDLPTAGSVFGDFTIERELGRGGMGVVYLARQGSLSRSVALKVIAPQFAEDSDFERRFDREARHAASIDHPNVVPVFETGRTDGLLYLAMRYVKGTDLRALLDHGPLSHTDAARITTAVGDALDAAHSQGLVHRDVKPGNILLAGDGPDGHVYLGDFGLTKDATSESGGLTLTGQVVGTLDYMAPEQIDGQAIDARTDVYALGCVLFQMLSGQVPYAGTQAQKMFAHATKPPPSLTTVAPDLAPAFDPVVARAMAKNPDDRYPSAGDLGRAAQAAASGQPVATPERSVATGMAARGFGGLDAVTEPGDAGAADGAAPRDTGTGTDTVATPEPASEEERGASRRRAALAVAGVAALLAVGGAVVLLSADDDDTPASAGTDGTATAVADDATTTSTGGGQTGAGADADEITALLLSYYQEPEPDQCASLVTEDFLTTAYATGSDSLAACRTHQEQRSAMSPSKRAVTVENIQVNGTQATADVSADGHTGRHTLVKTDERWLLDASGGASTAPAATPTTTQSTASGPMEFGEPATFASIPGLGPATEIRLVARRPIDPGRDRRGARSARMRFLDDFGQPGRPQRVRFINLPITLTNTGSSPFKGDVSAFATTPGGRQFSPLDRRDIAQRTRSLGRLPDWTTGEADGIQADASSTRFLTFAVPLKARIARWRVLPNILTGSGQIASMQPIDGVVYRAPS